MVAPACRDENNPSWLSKVSIIFFHYVLHCTEIWCNCTPSVHEKCLSPRISVKITENTTYSGTPNPPTPTINCRLKCITVIYVGGRCIYLKLKKSDFNFFIYAYKLSNEYKAKYLLFICAEHISEHLSCFELGKKLAFRLEHLFHKIYLYW